MAPNINSKEVKSHSVIPYTMMKRHLINNDETSEKEDLKQCPKTSLTILGSCRTLVGEDRDASESERRNSKRRKLESQQEESNSEDRSKLRYLDLVSSAAKLLSEKDKKKEEEEQQRRTQAADPICSAVSRDSTTRASRSNSISSEHSVYRSYEMELPDQPNTECMNKSHLLRAPRLPTATDIPVAQEIGCQLNTRRYGERPAFIDGNEGVNKNSENDLVNQHPFRIQTVIYR